MGALIGPNVPALSVCAWALGDTAACLPPLRALGFESVDLEPVALDDPQLVPTLERERLSPCCIAADHGLPLGCSLTGDEQARVMALAHLATVLRRWSAIGGRFAYVTPHAGVATTKELGDTLAQLAEWGSSVGVSVCVEHAPGQAVVTASGGLELVRAVGHPSLFLLIDIGHCIISGEDPGHAIARTGSLLGYVHLDDNDGVSDLHWKPLDGRLTEAMLKRVADALGDVRAGIALELSPRLPNPTAALREARELMLTLLTQAAKQ